MGAVQLMQYHGNGMPWTHRSFWLLPLIIAAILGLLALIVSRTRLRHIYGRHFAETRRERLFLAGDRPAMVLTRGYSCRRFLHEAP